MTPQSALVDLLARVGASLDAAALLSNHELNQWPDTAVAALKIQRLLVKAQPATTAICPGCERDCVMPVHTRIHPSRGAVSFIDCDKRSDVSRVAVPVDRLEQWRCTADAVCSFVAASLGLRQSDKRRLASADFLEIGMATGDKRIQMLCLQTDGELMLMAGGNTVPLADTIAYDKNSFLVDVPMIRLLVDSGIPAEGAPATVAENPCAVFLAMENLDASELSIAFVGDRSESGLGANNLLEITARKQTRRVALAELELVDRRGGSANSQGVVLLGMALKKKLTYTGANAAKMKRLRNVFGVHLGIGGDPFEPYRKGAGWVPRFKIMDKRGAADERAKREAERRTDSYEQLNERGDRFADTGPADSLLDADTDDADEWLRNNDPDETA